MDLYEWIVVSEEYQISLIAETEDLSEDLQKTIENLWNKESKQRNLQDHQIVSLVAMKEDKMICKAVNYRNFLAQILLPELKSVLNICPVAVCAIANRGEYYLVGKRSQQVLQCPGMYEFVPSGSLDAEDPHPKKQILKELSEECGIDRKSVNHCELKLISHNLTNPLVEFCYLLELEEVQIKLSSEYSELIWMRQEEVQKSFQHKEWVLFSKKLFEMLLT